MQILKSACPLDCPDACSLEVRTEEGRIASIDGSRVNPLTQGYICAKVRRFADHVYSSDRILSPGIRSGRKGEGRFRKASWDEALSLVADRMTSVRRTLGGEGILPFSYGGLN